MMFLPLTTLAATRSMSFRQPCMSTMKFSGLRSRMMTPWVERYSRMRIMLAMQNCVSSVERMPISRMPQQSSSPWMNYTSEQRQCSSLKLLQYYMMKGWQRLLSRFFSWVMYLKSECSSIFCLLQHFSTYSFCFSSSFVQPTSRIGPNSPSLSSCSITSWSSPSMSLFLLFICSWNFSACFFSFSSTTVSRYPPIISFTISVFISAITPSDSITMSSSYLVLILFSRRNSSPQIWDLTAMGLMFLYFLRAPSMTMMIFWLLTLSVFFFITTLPLLQLLIFIRSRIFSICYLLSFDRCVLFSIAHFMKLRKVTTKIWSPSTLLSVSRPRIRQVMSSSAFTVICRTVLQKSACYPKESVFSSLVISLLPLQTAADPSLMMQKDEPGSPSFTITCPFAYSWVMRAPAMVSLWSLERLLKNLTFSMNFLFSSYSRMMISSTALRKVFLSIAQRWQCSQAFTEKALGDLQRRAISPNPSPTLSVFLILSLEKTCIMPFSMMKKHMALEPSLKTQESFCTEQQNIFLATFSISASLRLQKMKWFLRQPSRKVISWYFFSFFSRWNSSSKSTSFTASSPSLSQVKPAVRTRPRGCPCAHYRCPSRLFKLIAHFQMQKKMKRGIIIAAVSLLVIALTLALLGLARIELDQSALNYNMITANFSDSSLYGPGLYWIGIANQFLRFNKNQQILRFANISTYSSDFYAIRANMEVTIQYNFEASADPFTSASDFLVLFAENPLSVIRPLINNEISVTLSSKNSSFYQQQSQPNAILEQSIKSKVEKALLKWVAASVTVIVESVICEGSVSNTQTIDRQIQTLLNDYQRAAQQRVELTDYFSNIYSNKLQQVEAARSALQAKSLQLGRIYDRYSSSGQPANLTQALYNSRPIQYNMNLVGLLEEIAALGNRTFPY